MTAWSIAILSDPRDGRSAIIPVGTRTREELYADARERQMPSVMICRVEERIELCEVDAYVPPSETARKIPKGVRVDAFTSASTQVLEWLVRNSSDPETKKKAIREMARRDAEEGSA